MARLTSDLKDDSQISEIFLKLPLKKTFEYLIAAS